ncbi:MAG TPA: hypothetical protein VMX14_13440 [Anaerolineae bacterium]|nr:hypothetical protein [Anaerolineae bacterium]
MNQFGRHTLKMLALISIIALIVSTIVVGCGRRQPVTIEDVPPDQIVALGVTHFSGMDITGTETDEFVVDQTSSGDIVEFQDNDSTVWRLADGGTITHAGANNMTGDLAVTGDISVVTGDLKVGNANPSVTLNGEDAFVEGTLEVAGQSTFSTTINLQNGETIVNSTNGTIALSGALDVQGGEITLSNDETIGNLTNGTVAITGTTISARGNLATTGSLDVQGGDITLQNDETIGNGTNGTIAMTVAADGTVNVLTGSLKVGNGSNSVALNGEDAFVEGTLEVGGQSTFSSTINLENGETIVNSTDGTIGITPESTGSVNILTGNLKVGNGSNSVALNGEDAFVEGTLEVGGATTLSSTINLENGETIVNSTNGTIALSGALDVQGGEITLSNDETIGNLTNGTVAITATTISARGNLATTGSLDVQGGDITLQNDETIGNTVNGNIGITVTATGLVNVATGNLKVGNGAPSVALNGEDGFIEGTLEVGGATTLSGTVNLENGETIVNSTNGTIGITPEATGSVNILTGNLKVGNGNPSVTLDGEDAFVEGTMEVGGAVTLSSTVTSVGNATFASLVDIGTWMNLSAQAAVSIADGESITPTGTYQPITTTTGAAFTTSTSIPIVAGTRAGDILILENINSAAITVDGTGGTVECTADLVLATRDTATLLWNGTAWICLMLYHN